MKILHLEDNARDAALVRDVLLLDWPGCAIRVVANRPDFTAALAAKLGSAPTPVTEPVYDQLDHETSWARFNSREWNERI